MDLAWTHSPLWVLLNSLVAFRLTRLWVDDTVPPLPWLRERIDNWARERVTARYRRAADIDDRSIGAPLTDAQLADISTVDAKLARYGGEHPVAYLMTCHWCSGFWISLAVVLAASLIPGTVWTLIALPFALSAVVGLLAILTP